MKKLALLLMVLGSGCAFQMGDGSDDGVGSVEEEVSRPPVIDCDADHDGYRSIECGGDDCNDLNAEVHPDENGVCKDDARCFGCPPG